MRRDDWFWLAIKLAGLYALVVAVGHLSEMLNSIWSTATGEQPILAGLLDTGIFAAAGFLLIFGGPRFFLDRLAVGTTGAAPVQEPTATAAPSALTRDDWLWLLCKAGGLLLIADAISALATQASLLEEGVPSVFFFASLAMLACGIWLLFSAAIPRWAGGSGGDGRAGRGHRRSAAGPQD